MGERVHGMDEVAGSNPATSIAVEGESFHHRGYGERGGIVPCLHVLGPGRTRFNAVWRGLGSRSRERVGGGLIGAGGDDTIGT